VKIPPPGNRICWLAALCAIAWFALWLLAFHPVSGPAFCSPTRPAVAISPSPGAMLRSVQSPTLFAFPSKQGFSGTFPENRVSTHPMIERSRPPETYLSRRLVPAPAPDQTKLIEQVSLPQSELPAPGATQTEVVRRPGRMTLFCSPELLPRANGIELPGDLEILSSTSIRIHLTVRPDGRVAHAFFESPARQPALLNAVRKLRFSPAAEKTEGRLDIRFTQTQLGVPR